MRREVVKVRCGRGREERRDKAHTVTVNPSRLSSIADRVSFLPHAVLGVAVEDAVRRVGAPVEAGTDELDAFSASGLILHDGPLGDTPFVVLHYRGHPPDTSTIYLPPSVTDVGVISSLVASIVEGLRLSQTVVTWQRADSPEL
jgi:hypothetical protein